MPPKQPRLNQVMLHDKWTRNRGRLEDWVRLHMHAVTKTYRYALTFKRTMHHIRCLKANYMQADKQNTATA